MERKKATVPPWKIIKEKMIEKKKDKVSYQIAITSKIEPEHACFFLQLLFIFIHESAQGLTEEMSRMLGGEVTTTHLVKGKEKTQNISHAN